MRLLVMLAVVLTASVAFGQTAPMRPGYSFRTEVRPLNPDRATTTMPDGTVIRHERDSTGSWTHQIYTPPQPRPKTPEQIRAEKQREINRQLWQSSLTRKPKRWWRIPQF